MAARVSRRPHPSCPLSRASAFASSWAPPKIFRKATPSIAASFAIRAMSFGPCAHRGAHHSHPAARDAPSARPYRCSRPARAAGGRQRASRRFVRAPRRVMCRDRMSPYTLRWISTRRRWRINWRGAMASTAAKAIYLQGGGYPTGARPWMALAPKLCHRRDHGQQMHTTSRMPGCRANIRAVLQLLWRSRLWRQVGRRCARRHGSHVLKRAGFRLCAKLFQLCANIHQHVLGARPSRQ